MALEQLADSAGAAAAAAEAQRLMARLYPLCRSITGNGVRRSLDLLGELVPLQRHEVASGTPVYDWEVPREWNVRDAYVADADGHRVIDFRAHNLHLLNYSVPVRRTMSLEELQPHLHSLPEQPDWIPYRTSYYREDWGFCLRHRDRERLPPGRYQVVVDTTLEPGHLSYAECVVPGRSADQLIVYTHTCHPSLANDNLTGMAVAALLARALLQGPQPRATWRFVFGPGTIGSLTWLSRNEALLPRLVGGLVIGLLGDPGPLTYKRSRRGDSATDRAAAQVLRAAVPGHRLEDFEPYGYDERQFCSPGFDLAVGRLTRSPNGRYPQYHSSADDLSLLQPAALAESIGVLARLLPVLDANRLLLNLQPKGEPRLGKRGLYGTLGGLAPAALDQATLWLLSLSDGHHDLVGIAERSGLEIGLLDRAAQALERVELLRVIDNKECP